MSGGQRLFDDASLRLAKGRRLLDPMDAFWVILAQGGNQSSETFRDVFLLDCRI